MAHGQRDRGAIDPAPDAVPPDAQIVGRKLLPIPGLAQPHELLIVGRARAAEAEPVNLDG
jgi:hypothetical protein